MAKEYIQETEQHRRDSKPEDDFLSYCDILREQRKVLSGSTVPEQAKTVEDDFDYRPVKIPKKPDSSESFLSLRLKHDRAMMKSKKSSRFGDFARFIRCWEPCSEQHKIFTCYF